MTSERPLLERDVEYRPAVPASLEAIHLELDQFWTDVSSELTSSIADRWKLEFISALSEICANIIQHAFAGFPQQGTIELRLSLYSDRVEAEIVDDGVLFDEQPGASDPDLGPDTDLPESGRGLQVARALLDKLSYRRSEESKNHWLLVKMLP